MKISIILLSSLLILFSAQVVNAQSWEEQAVGLLPTNYGVFDIAVVDENIVWAVAFDQTLGGAIPLTHVTKVIKTLDGGLSWEIFDIEEAEGTISFDIEAFDANTAFITTQDFGNGIGKGVFKTEDGGESWIQKLNNEAAGVWIRFFNPQDGLVINRDLIATTSDGGETWQLVSSDNIPPFQGNEFTILSSGNNSCQVIDDHIWFGTNKERVYRSKDKGYTWEAFDLSFGTNALILSVAFRDTLNGVAVNASSTVNTSFAETTDGGETWENITPSPGLAIRNIAYVPGTDGVLIGTSDNATSVNNRVSAYSIDFGKNWQIINTGVSFGGTEFLTPNIGWTSKGGVSSPDQPAIYKWEGEFSVNSKEIELNNNYKVFPNPFTDNVFISSPVGIKRYNLMTSDGQVIQSENIDSPFSDFLTFKNLNLGMYILEVITDDDKKITKKILKVN